MDMRGHSRDPLAQEPTPQSVTNLPNQGMRFYTPDCIRRYAEQQKRAERKRIAGDFAFGVFCLFCVGAIIAFYILGGVTGR